VTPIKRRLTGWLLPVGLAVVVISLVTIALTRGPVSLDPDTPEGTVQEYLQAINDRRWDDAIAVIHDDWRGFCQGSDLQAFASGDFSAALGTPSGLGGFSSPPQLGPITEVGPTQATIPEDTTRVDVTISHHDGGGLGSSWEEHVAFELSFDGDFWWIVGDPWPYFVFNCSGR
jgi:hypothetical protein